MATALVALAGCAAKREADVRVAEGLVTAGNPRRAIAVYEGLLKTRPDVAASGRVGTLYAGLGEFARAVPHLEQAYLGKPSAATGSLLALCRAASGNLSGARTLGATLGERERGVELSLLVRAALAQAADEQEALLPALRDWRKRAGERAPLELLVGLVELAPSAADAPNGAAIDGAHVADEVWALGLGLVHQRLGRPLAATRLLAPIARQRPADAGLWARVLDLALVLQDRALAKEALTKLPAAAATPAIELLRARALLLGGQATAACDVLERALAAGAGDHALSMRLLRARCLAEQNRADQAERELAAITSPPAAAAQAKLALAELLVTLSAEARALPVLQALLAEAPALARTHYWLARAHAAAGSLPDAERELRLYLSRPGRDDDRAELLDARYRLALLRRAQGDEPDTQRVLESLLAEQPDAHDALRALVARMPKPRAEQRLRDQISRTRDPIPVKLALAEAIAAQGRADEAAGMLRELRAAAPRDLRPTLALANQALRAGKADAALALLEGAKPDHPGDPTLWSMLGTTYAELGKAAQAAATYRELLNGAPDSVGALNNLAFVEASSLAQLDDALAHARRARALAPRSAEVADTLGFVHWKRGELAEALPLLQEAARALPEQPSVWFHLGAVQAQSGTRAEAKRTLSRALAMKARFPEAAEARALLSTL